MKLPSKIISFNESVIGKITPIIIEIRECDMTVFALYKKTKKFFSGIEEFVDVLDFLFALQKIIFLKDMGVVHYVA